MKKNIYLVLLCSFCFLWNHRFLLGEDIQVPRNKQTVLGLYLTAKDAFKQWQANPSGIILLDVRTPEEYMFVGHATHAYNIPFMVLREKWYKDKTGPAMVMNPQFLSQMRQKFKETATIFTICRSGGRSAGAVNILAKAGYKNVYSVVDGFEGDKVKDRNSEYFGKRKANGWKNSGAPWTYQLDPKLFYNPN